MKNVVEKVFSNRTNQIIFVLYILLEILMLNSNTSLVWIVSLTLILILGLILEFIYDFPLKKSVLIQLCIILGFIVLSILYAVIINP